MKKASAASRSPPAHGSAHASTSHPPTRAQWHPQAAQSLSPSACPPQAPPDPAPLPAAPLPNQPPARKLETTLPANHSAASATSLAISTWPPFSEWKSLSASPAFYRAAPLAATHIRHGLSNLI